MSQQQMGSAPPTCAAGCGFFGSPANLDMCSVCYKKHCCAVTGGPSASAAAATAVTPGAAGSTAAAKPMVAAPAASVCMAPAKGGAAEADAAPEAAKKARTRRCAACCKKVGLTGFVCRCGETFCGSHRYAEEHGCSFDFKGASRDAIARANPVIKGEKLAGKI